MSPNLIIFHYEIKDKSGKPLDQSGSKPEVIIESQQHLVKPLYNLIKGLQKGGLGTVNLKASEAFGDYDSELVLEVHKNEFQDPVNVGDRVAMQLRGGKKTLIVVDTKDTVYILDGNHPLAGRDITYSVELIERRPATKAELDKFNIKATNTT